MPFDTPVLDRPFVSVIIPCRNERLHIAEVLRSVLSSTYRPHIAEILVVDGSSTDGTREVLQELAARHPEVQLLENPERIIPEALNRGLRAARGDVVVRMDAHTTYPPDYIERCVAGLLATGADNVGGVCEIVPGQDNLLGRAVAAALSHPFGTGNALYKIGVSRPTEVDAVPFGCMWRKRMEEIGPFDPRFARSEDMDYSARLRAQGGSMLLLPDVRSYYRARSTIAAFVRHSLSNGFWITYPLGFTRLPNSWRHYVPLAFVLSLAGSVLLAPAWPTALWVGGFIAAVYGLAAISVAAGIGWKARSPSLALATAGVLPLLHVSYGFGSGWGLVAAAWRRISDTVSHNA